MHVHFIHRLYTRRRSYRPRVLFSPLLSSHVPHLTCFVKSHFAQISRAARARARRTRRSRSISYHLPPKRVITPRISYTLWTNQISTRDLAFSSKSHSISRPSVSRADPIVISLIAFTCQQSLGNGGEGRFVTRQAIFSGLSSPRHVALHKAHETATNFRPRIVFPHRG